MRKKLLCSFELKVADGVAVAPLLVYLVTIAVKSLLSKQHLSSSEWNIKT